MFSRSPAVFNKGNQNQKYMNIWEWSRQRHRAWYIWDTQSAIQTFLWKVLISITREISIISAIIVFVEIWNVPSLHFVITGPLAFVSILEVRGKKEMEESGTLSLDLRVIWDKNSTIGKQ